MMHSSCLVPVVLACGGGVMIWGWFGLLGLASAMFSILSQNETS